jgi:predicted phage terminase large subunit-like protein
MASSLAVLGQVKRLQRLAEEARSRRPIPAIGSTDLPGLADLPIIELIPRLNPDSRPPLHLQDTLVDELERAIAPHQGQRFYWFSVPPRHWKTTTLVNGCMKHLLRWPGEGVAYFSHTQSFASKQSREMRRLAERCKLGFARDSNRQDEWELSTGGGLVARGIGAVPSGRGFRLIVIDDPFQGRAQANSKVERDRVFDAIEDDALTRLSPDGSLFLVHTRWHPDDPIGRYAKRRGWHGDNLPALGGPESDQALLPSEWPFEVLDQIRRSNPYKFAALYQGEPILPGEQLFRQPATYEWAAGIPSAGRQAAYGVDLAYSAKTTGDWSVCVKLVKINTSDGPLYYVADVQRKHVDAPSCALTLKALVSSEPGGMLWYAATSEMGAAQFIAARVPGFEAKQAKVDKFQRAQPASEAWNLGRILVPTGEGRPEWVDDFVDELTGFTGVKDAHDDQVDSLAAAFDLLNLGPVPEIPYDVIEPYERQW